MAGTGGKRKGAGRKSKVDEQKVNTIFTKALKSLYRKDTDDNNKIAFVKDLLESQRGQIFIAEHLFGKSPDIIKQTVISENDLTQKEIDLIRKEFKDKYQ